jgi:hypothetical protein
MPQPQQKPRLRRQRLDGFAKCLGNDRLQRFFHHLHTFARDGFNLPDLRRFHQSLAALTGNEAVYRHAKKPSAAPAPVEVQEDSPKPKKKN